MDTTHEGIDKSGYDRMLVMPDLLTSVKSECRLVRASLSRPMSNDWTFPPLAEVTWRGVFLKSYQKENLMLTPEMKEK